MADYGDFLQAFQVGANVQNMAWQRQERMQQLRAQEAELRIRERQEAAQAAMFMEHSKYYKAQAEQFAEDQADLKAGNDFYLQAKKEGKSEAEALASAVGPMAMKNPRLASMIALAQQRLQAGDNQKPQSGLGKLIADRNAAFKAGNMNEIPAYDKAIAVYGKEMGVKTTVRPDGTIETTYGKLDDEGVGTTTRNELEKKIAANERSMAMMQESMKLISPKNVGPVGAFNEWLEVVSNVVKPGSMSTEVTEARQTFRVTAQQMYQSLKADSQINRLEGDEMRKIADITKLKESDPTAKAKYRTLFDLHALQSALYYKELGKPVPEPILTVMSKEMVNRAWKRGDITDDDLVNWNNIHKLVQ